MLPAMNHREAHKRLLAVQTLLMEPTTTREKFSSIRTLIEGVNPRVDKVLADCEHQLSTWDKIEQGDVIHLTAENLPENTEEEKKRKKWLLLFIHSWKQLKGEVARVQQEMQDASSAQTTGGKASHWGKIFSAAKGPLGIITVIAIGVAVMQQTSVQITIQNKGCATMYPSGSIPISIPGLSLPSEPIASGGSAVMTIPPFALHVDGTKSGAVTLTALNYTFTFQLPGNVSDVTLNGQSLLGTKTEVHLSEEETHTLVLKCS